MPATPIGAATFYMTTPTFVLALLSDGDDVVSRKGTVASGIGILKRGTIVNIVPDTGVITVPTTVAGCNAILVDDIDATSATVEAGVYLSAKVKADALTWPGVLNHALITDQMRDYGILIESVQFTDGSTVKSAPTAEEESEAKKNLDRARALHKEAARELAEEKKDQPPPADSAWGYMSPEEKETDSELSYDAAHLARAEFEQKHGEHARRPAAPPPKPPEEPNRKK